MPSTTQLPEDLRSLVFRQAITIGSGRDFDHHVEDLIHGLEDLLNAPVAQKPSDHWEAQLLKRDAASFSIQFWKLNEHHRLEGKTKWFNPDVKLDGKRIGSLTTAGRYSLNFKVAPHQNKFQFRCRASLFVNRLTELELLVDNRPLLTE